MAKNASKLRMSSKVSRLSVSFKVKQSIYILKIKLTDEVQPYCTQTTCVCPHGYKMIEYAYGAICRLEDQDPQEDGEQQPGRFLSRN